MTRRVFLAATGTAIGFPARNVVLEAVYGARLPSTLHVPRSVTGGQRFLEVRTYRAGAVADHVVRAVSKVVAQPSMVRKRNDLLIMTIPFHSLKERGRLWNGLNCDPEWTAIGASVRLCELTIYRRRVPLALSAG